METAMCLIEANQPVYPLEICRQMRNQRAMMIQTPVSNHYDLVFLSQNLRQAMRWVFQLI